MIENFSEIQIASTRAEKRVEILGKRIEIAKNNTAIPLPAGSDWLDVEKQAKNIKAIERLSTQVGEYLETAPDLSEDLDSLGLTVARLTRQDDRGEIDDSSWAYEAILNEYRALKSQEAAQEELQIKTGFLRQEKEKLDLSRIVYVNADTHQAMVGGRLVTFANPRDWAVFIHFIENRNKGVLPKNISRIARENGSTDANASSTSVARLRKLIENDPKDPKIITTVGDRNKARYEFSAEVVRFFYESKEHVIIKPEAIQLTPGNIFNFDDYRKERENKGKRQVELNKRDPNLMRRIQDVLNEVAETPEFKGNKLASLDQVSRAFPSLKIDYIAELREKYFSPQQREGDHHHPGFEKYEIAFMVYYKRHGERLKLPPILVKELLQMIEGKAIENANSSDNSRQ